MEVERWLGIDSQKITQYLSVREDISPGAKFAQLAHAAGESFKCRGSPIYVVVLGVPDENALLKMERKIQRAKIKYHLITEPDPPFNGEATAIGVEPIERNRVAKLFSSLPLLK